MKEIGEIDLSKKSNAFQNEFLNSTTGSNYSIL